MHTERTTLQIRVGTGVGEGGGGVGVLGQEKPSLDCWEKVIRL